MLELGARETVSVKDSIRQSTMKLVVGWMVVDIVKMMYAVDKMKAGISQRPRKSSKRPIGAYGVTELKIVLLTVLSRRVSGDCTTAMAS